MTFLPLPFIVFKVKLLVILMLLVTFKSITCFAQTNFRTSKGSLRIITNVRDTDIAFHSNSMEMLLDYNTAWFEIKLDTRSLHASNDSFGAFFNNMKDPVLIIKGKMGLQEIETSNHDPYHFNFSGTLYNEDIESEIHGDGHLEHFYSDKNLACRLGLSFEIGPQNLIYKSINKDFCNPLQFQIIQAILRQDK